VLPFKLEMTKDIITAHARLGLLGEWEREKVLTGLRKQIRYC